MNVVTRLSRQTNWNRELQQQNDCQPLHTIKHCSLFHSIFILHSFILREGYIRGRSRFQEVYLEEGTNRSNNIMMLFQMGESSYIPVSVTGHAGQLGSTSWAITIGPDFVIEMFRSTANLPTQSLTPC
jgi:hypothetical protein